MTEILSDFSLIFLRISTGLVFLSIAFAIITHVILYLKDNR